jgi:release factor glutamine methyltransferase
MTLHERINAARDCFLKVGIRPEEAALDAELLARDALGWDRAALLAALHDPAPPSLEPSYQMLVARRLAREPVAYILGRREFWGLDFEVGPGVLVPRPETELIVEEAQRVVGSPGSPGPRLVADVGTGSGCLAVTLARDFGDAAFVATDSSRAALAFASRNAARHGVASRIALVETDLLEGVDGPFDLIVSNPPYVPEGDVPSLPPEVRQFEPIEALVGGADGLDVIRRLLVHAEARLRAGGFLVFEFGFGQEPIVRQAVGCHVGLVLERVANDLQGIPRTAIVRRR